MICLSCGNQFEHQNKLKRYCSLRCRLKGKPKTKLVCKECGKVFFTNRKTKVYCSKECRSEAARRAFKENIADPKKIVKNCRTCNKWFEVTIQNKTQKYCSPECEAKSPIKPPKSITCRYCGMEVHHPTITQYTCGSDECQRAASIERRVLKYGVDHLRKNDSFVVKPGNRVLKTTIAKERW